jgi:hypothetical protein
MVEPGFARLSRRDQFQRLRRRCGADMFVCLKNVFASDAFDAILLREYAQLDQGLQDVYRYVCGLEAIGTHVHRQLVLRLLGIEAQVISGLLEVLEGLVDEYDIDPGEGLYGWSTRHPVIARIITR